jgi:hypothetical protein
MFVYFHFNLRLWSNLSGDSFGSVLHGDRSSLFESSLHSLCERHRSRNSQTNAINAGLRCQRMTSVTPVRVMSKNSSPLRRAPTRPEQVSISFIKNLNSRFVVQRGVPSRQVRHVAAFREVSWPGLRGTAGARRNRLHKRACFFGNKRIFALADVVARALQKR